MENYSALLFFPLQSQAWLWLGQSIIQSPIKKQASSTVDVIA